MTIIAIIYFMIIILTTMFFNRYLFSIFHKTDYRETLFTILRDSLWTLIVAIFLGLVWPITISVFIIITYVDHRKQRGY